MKILYDGEIYSIFQRGGVIRYFHNLISRLPSQCHPIVLGNDGMPESPGHPNLKQHVYSNRWVPPALKFVRKSLDRRYCRTKFRSLVPDLIHPTYFQHVARGRYDQRKAPMILTVYDMIHERFADQIDKSGKHSRLKRAAVKRADHILCISETTRQDLIDYFEVEPNRTSVTMLGVEPQFYRLPTDDSPPTNNASESKRIIAEPYFVFVGRRDLYKNWDRLLEAFQVVHSRQSDLRLAVVGSEFSEAEHQQINQMGLSTSIRHLGTVDDPTLVQIYQSALGFIFPTLWEGFGLPLLEGIASGTCVLASDIPVFREIAAGGFQPFDPYDAESMADAMLQVANDPELRQQRIDQGRQLLQRYDWTRTATETFEIYQQVVANYKA